jgi:hypothetical protein
MESALSIKATIGFIKSKSSWEENNGSNNAWVLMPLQLG